MILWAALLMLHFYFDLNGAAAEGTRLERIEKCDTRCSEGLKCKNKRSSFFPPPCQNPAEGVNASTVFHNVSLSTVMKCEGRQKCSLYLRVKTTLQLTESIHGLTICTVTAMRIDNCRTISFTKSSRENLLGHQVEVVNDCIEVFPHQNIQVTVKTVPSYCDVSWSGMYDGPDCAMEDLRKHVPECITGSLSYDINEERKELRVNVSDMLEDYNYYLRLCHRDFICFGTGANTLIKKEEPVKSATLSYSRPLPCLCIEGWSAVVDATRVQVCPFKDRLEELWFGVSFDSLVGILSWQTQCRVNAVVALCQKREDDVCVDLPHSSQNISRAKITFAEVDPHPQLCMKFTAGTQSWTQCPFTDGRLKTWELVSMTQQGRDKVRIESQTAATFSVEMCEKSSLSVSCEMTEKHSVHVEKNTAVDLDLGEKQCNSCIQVKRLDVKYSATVMHCLEKCSDPTSLDLTWVIVPAGVCLSGIIIVTLVLHVLLNVNQKRRRQQGNDDVKQRDPALDSEVSSLQAHHHHKGILIPDSPQCGVTEKANLILE